MRLDSIVQPFEPECLIRIFIAAVCGSLIGIERERRAKNAGIRTHILVAISSALMMAVSKYGFFDVVGYEGISLDASRIAAGVVTAIGFLGAGVIFVRKENTVGLTTSAGLWATVGMGIAIGAGMYVTGIVFTIFILIIQFILHSHFLYSSAFTSAEMTVSIKDMNLTLEMVVASLKKAGISVRNAQLEIADDSSLVFTGRVVFRSQMSVSELMCRIRRLGFICEINRIKIS